MLQYIYSAKGAGYKFTDAMKDTVEKHFKKLEKLLGKEPIKVSIEKNGDGCILKIQVVTTDNKHIRSEVTGVDFYSLVGEAKDSIERQIKKAKEKLTWKEKGKPMPIEDIVVDAPVVKVKDFKLESMTPEMAIHEMERLGHTFYVYKGLYEDQICVVYKRFEDNYSIIRCH